MPSILTGSRPRRRPKFVGHLRGEERSGNYFLREAYGRVSTIAWDTGSGDLPGQPTELSGFVDLDRAAGSAIHGDVHKLRLSADRRMR